MLKCWFTDEFEAEVKPGCTQSVSIFTVNITHGTDIIQAYKK
jgi:hypothetical protein